MKSLTTIALMQEYAKLSGKFCMYISFDGYYDFGCPGDLDNLLKAAPYLEDEVDPQIICDHVDRNSPACEFFDDRIG